MPEQVAPALPLSVLIPESYFLSSFALRANSNNPG